jgi:hypothetical protein
MHRREFLKTAAAAATMPALYIRPGLPAVDGPAGPITLLPTADDRRLAPLRVLPGCDPRVSRQINGMRIANFGTVSHINTAMSIRLADLTTMAAPPKLPTARQLLEDARRRADDYICGTGRGWTELDGCDLVAASAGDLVEFLNVFGSIEAVARNRLRVVCGRVAFDLEHVGLTQFSSAQRALSLAYDVRIIASATTWANGSPMISDN